VLPSKQAYAEEAQPVSRRGLGPLTRIHPPPIPKLDIEICEAHCGMVGARFTLMLDKRGI